MPGGVSIQLPNDWVAFSGNERVFLDSLVNSKLDLARIDHGSSETVPTVFAANYFDDQENTLGFLNIRYRPHPDLTQEYARNATEWQVRELDASIKDTTLKSMNVLGGSISLWNGTEKANINGVTAFVTDYRRSDLEGLGQFRDRIIWVFAGTRSLILTISYLDSASLLLQPATDQIIHSLSLSGLDGPQSINESFARKRTIGDHIARWIGGAIFIGLAYGVVAFALHLSRRKTTR